MDFRVHNGSSNIPRDILKGVRTTAQSHVGVSLSGKNSIIRRWLACVSRRRVIMLAKRRSTSDGPEENAKLALPLKVRKGSYETNLKSK